MRRVPAEREGGRARAWAARGFTLIELLLVMALMAVILGVGMGIFARLDLGDRVAVALVQDALRSAQNFSVARSAPARVRIDAKSGAMRAEGMLVIGTWHFEGLPIRGAFGIEGSMLGGRLVDDGFQGQALSFVGEPARSKVEIPVQGDPSWDLRDGFALRCALRPAKESGGPVLAIGETVGLETTGSGGVHAWFAPEVTDPHGERVDLRRGGRIPLDAPSGSLVPDRWAVVEIQYDRRALRLFVDGALAAEVEESAPVWKVDGPIVLSPSSAAWPGAIDNLSVSAVAAREESRLPRGASFAAGTPSEILFAPGGGLDRDVHKEPVRIAIDFEDGRHVPILVNRFGTVQ
jgi:prepilin-type N-terminal cleavage/methylation domain-containing protein